MAGRGKRIGERSEAFKNVPKLGNSDISLLINKINEINIQNINLTLISSIHNLFKKSCGSKKILKDIISNLYSKSLSDIDFGQKFLIAFEELSHYEVEGFLVRTELLSYVQEDFKLKDFISQSDPKKFLNVVMMLGIVYQRIKIYGVPIVILGVALIEYFDLLLKGGEEELKVLAKQIWIHGKRMSATEELSQNFEKLKHNIRSTLINRNLNSSCKCWILLILEFMNNDLRPLSGIVRNFYYGYLGDEFTKLESLIETGNQIPENSLNSSEIKKDQGDSSSVPRNVEKNKEFSDNRKDVEKKLSHLKVSRSDTSSFGRKEDLNFYDTRKENKQWQTSDSFWSDNAWGRSNSSGVSTHVPAHDDRFDREENFYGIQTPRRPKPEN